MGKVRRRTKAGGGSTPSKKVETTSNSKSDSNATKNSTFSNFDWGPTEDATLLETFLHHPMIKCIFISIPFVLYYHYNTILLQYPHWISTITAGLIPIRPSVTVSGERQVLILGSQMNKDSSTIASTEMNHKLHLEIGQNQANTMSNFVRDGTASWFHILRYLPPIQQLDNNTAKALDTFCGFGTILDDEYGVPELLYTQRKHTSNFGFHPNNYRTSIHQCSLKNHWSKCWSAECYQYIMKEWSCSTTPLKTESESESGKSMCETPFRNTLHQVQNPLRNMEDIVAAYCTDGIDATMDASFVAYASSLFYWNDHDFTKDSCVEVAANFVYLYNQVLLDAAKKGLVDGMYRLEEGSVCDVAELAGFFSTGEEDRTAVYGPNQDKVLEICQMEGDPLGVRKPLLPKVEEEEEELKKEEGIRLGWEDLRGGVHGSKRGKGDTSLEVKVKKLFKDLGYDASLEH